MPGLPAGKGRYVLLLIRAGVVFCAIAFGAYWLSVGDNWAGLVSVFRRMNLLVFVAVLLTFVFSQTLVALRWWILLRTQSARIGIWPAVKLHFLGLFYNNFMPSSVGGDFVRAWYVTKHTHRRFEAALSVFVDRAIGLASTLIIAVFFYMVFLRGEAAVAAEKQEQTGTSAGSFAIYARVLLWLIVVTVLALAGLFLTAKGRAVLSRAWALVRKHALELARKFVNAAVLYCSKPFAILAAFGLTVLLQLLTITAFWALGRSLGIGVSAKYYYVFFTLTWVLGAIPVSIGGAGVVELSLAAMFVKFAGAGHEAAAALALCQRAVWMLASLLGAAIHLSGLHLPKDFSVDSDQAPD